MLEMKLNLESTSYVRMFIDRIEKYVSRGKRCLIYDPSKCFFKYFLNKFRDRFKRIVDLRTLIFRFRRVDSIFRYVYDSIREGYTLLYNVEYLLLGYPKSRGIITKWIYEVVKYPIVLYTHSYRVYRLIRRLGYDFEVIHETSISHLFTKLAEELKLHDYYKLMLSEGNLCMLKILYHDANDKELIIRAQDEILSLETGQRIALTYLTLYMLPGKLSKKLGSQSSVFINRLFRSGLLLRLYGRRGCYLVRDPIYRYALIKLLNISDDELHRYIGYMHIILKMIASIKDTVEIPTPTESLYISKLVGYKWISRNKIKFIDIHGLKYEVIFPLSDNISRYKREFSTDAKVKILIYPFDLRADDIRYARVNNIRLLGQNSLLSLRDLVKLDRVI